VDGLVYVQAPRFTPGTTTPEERAWIGHAALERLRDHPAMAGAAAGATAPLMWVMNNAIRLPETDPGVRSEPGMFWQNSITADYFRLLGMRVVHGRGFEPADYAPGARPVVVSESMARSLWRASDPLGECVYVGDETECSLVVGVVADARAPASTGPGPMQFFLPMTGDEAPAVVIVRPRVERAAALATIRSVVAGVDPRVRYVQPIPAAERLEPHERSWRLGATLFSVFGALALLVAGLGLYAVLAFDVSQRRREIGIRTAMGASPRRILRLVMGRALGVTAAGLLIGAAAAALVAPRFGELLFQVGPHDPITYAAVTLTLLAVAAAAAWLPARRAAAVDPSVTLRAE
jgi:putative ABC transport system permease protein